MGVDDNSCTYLIWHLSTSIFPKQFPLQRMKIWHNWADKTEIVGTTREEFRRYIFQILLAVEALLEIFVTKQEMFFEGGKVE